MDMRSAELFAVEVGEGLLTTVKNLKRLRCTGSAHMSSRDRSGEIFENNLDNGFGIFGDRCGIFFIKTKLPRPLRSQGFRSGPKTIKFILF